MLEDRTIEGNQSYTRILNPDLIVLQRDRKRWGGKGTKGEVGMKLRYCPGYVS